MLQIALSRVHVRLNYAVQALEKIDEDPYVKLLFGIIVKDENDKEDVLNKMKIVRGVVAAGFQSARSQDEIFKVSDHDDVV